LNADVLIDELLKETTMSRKSTCRRCSTDRDRDRSIWTAILCFFLSLWAKISSL